MTLYAVLAVSPVIFCVKVVKAIGLALTNVHPDDELCVSTYTLVPLLVFDIPFHTTVTSSFLIFVMYTLNGLWFTSSLLHAPIPFTNTLANFCIIESSLSPVSTANKAVAAPIVKLCPP